MVKPKNPRTIIILNEGQVKRLLNNITNEKGNKKRI